MESKNISIWEKGINVSWSKQVHFMIQIASSCCKTKIKSIKWSKKK